jgi:geranylgeranyl reductase family protein
MITSAASILMRKIVLEDGRMDSGAWDVIVVGAGPAGLNAARVAAQGGARTLVLERAVHPRYKTCGGGLIGTSLAAVAGHVDVPARDRIARVTFTLDGRRRIERTSRGGPLISMVRREEFDDALRKAALSAGAEVRERSTVRALEDGGGGPVVRLADGSRLAATVVVGADGSSGVTARHVGVRYQQVDLGLELELPVPERIAAHWRGRLLIDWGPLPGSYAWVFPKDDVLTVGVIAARGQADATRRYLEDFVARVGLAGITPVHDSGHLTRCRDDDAPLRRGGVIVAGDAAGLLEPWTREGISFALRSGALAGAAAARAAARGPDELDGYVAAVNRDLVPEMRAGRRLLDVFERRPWALHGALALPPGFSMFSQFCQGRVAFDELLTQRRIRAILAVLGPASAR